MREVQEIMCITSGDMSTMHMQMHASGQAAYHLVRHSQDILTRMVRFGIGIAESLDAVPPETGKVWIPELVYGRNICLIPHDG